MLVSCDAAPARQAWKEKLELDLHARLRLLAARRGREGLRRLRRDRPAPPVRGTFLIDKEGVVVWSLVNDADTRRDELVTGPLAASPLEPRPLRVGRLEPAARSSVCTASPVTAGTSSSWQSAWPTASTSSRSTCAGTRDSSWEPPWNLEQHVADVLDAAPPGAAAWLGHSFGGRIAYETAAAAPDRVERLVLLDPAILLPPQLGIAAAENARRDRSYVSFEEGIDRRYEESVLTTAPRELVAAELARPSAARRRRPVPVPLLPERRRRRVRRDDAAAAAVRGRSDPDAARARRDVVHPV